MSLSLELTQSSLARLLEIAPASITAEQGLVEDLGVDSIGFIQLADLLELALAERGIAAAVSDDALLTFTTVADVAAHVETLTGASA